MTLGFLLMDALYLGGLVGLLVAASLAGLGTYHAATSAALHPAPALVAGLLAAGLTWIFTVAAVTALLPRPRPGRFKLLAHPMFYLWMVTLVLRRYLDIPPVHTIVFQSNVLRFLVMRLLGARVHLTTSMSSDVLLLDPALFTAGPGCVLGAQTIFAGHLVLEGRLLLAPIRLGSRVEVGGRSLVGPGVEIGDDVRIGIAVSLAPGVTIGDGASIGSHVLVDVGASIGKGARVLGNTYVPPGAEVPDGAVWTGDEAVTASPP
jgi:hypothetical protein